MTTTETRERPILFSGPMIRAILDGTKTMTRRVMKPQPEIYTRPGPVFGDAQLVRWNNRVDTPLVIFPGAMRTKCPYGKAGDSLWCRETWHLWGPPERQFVDYRATCPDADQLSWKPSIHMPRAYSRISLEIVSVRVERVQDISEADAVAEGVPFEGIAICRGNERPDPRPVFARLWNAINGPRGYGWDVNPFVWVIEFKQVPIGNFPPPPQRPAT